MNMNAILILILVSGAVLIWVVVHAPKSPKQSTEVRRDSQRYETVEPSTVHAAPPATKPERLSWNLAHRKIAFVDVETTGLSAVDRLVTFAIIFFDASDDQNPQIRIIHRIYNPGVPCSAKASEIHGYGDRLLANQADISEDIDELAAVLSGADLIVAHNSRFDISFINRELVEHGLLAIEKPTFCTMQAYRERFRDSARLDNAASRYGLSRMKRTHGAAEDAWLAMQLYFCLNKHPMVPEPENLRTYLKLQNLQ